MGLESSIVAAIKADATIAVIVGDRVYPGHIAESAGMQPALYYRVISGNSGVNLDGADGTARTRLEIGCAAKTYGDVVTVAKAAIDLLKGFQGALGDVAILGIVQDGMRDSYEDTHDGSDLGTHCRSVDFLIREIG